VQFWERAVELNPNFSIAHRNLAVAYWHGKPRVDRERAIKELEKAVACPVQYAAHFGELDELYEVMGVSPEKRLSLLEKNQQIVAKRDDPVSREIGLKIFAGKYDEAIGLMTGRKFSVWEGGSLDVASHWVNAHLFRGRQRIQDRQFGEALADFRSAQSVPDNLPTEQELHRDVELSFWSGEACMGMGEQKEAQQFWQKATQFLASQESGRAKVSPQTSEAFYAAMAAARLGRSNDAEKTFQEILGAATRELNRDDDKKGASGAASRSRHAASRSALAHHLAGLSRLGLGQKDEAKEQFQLALQATPDFLPAKEELARFR
jgi:tetratricopeptide (TPR) repeat protein